MTHAICAQVSIASNAICTLGEITNVDIYTHHINSWASWQYQHDIKVMLALFSKKCI